MMRVLLTTASTLALLAAPALAATTPTTPAGAGTSGATTSHSTASQSTTNPSAGATTNAAGAQTGTNQTGTNQTGTSQTGTSQTASTATSNAGSASQADQTFVKQAGSGNLAEVQMGKLAVQKSRNPAVQEFGRWMETDHTMADALLTQAAKSSNIQVPTAPNATETAAMQKLQKLRGAQFNRQYIDGAVTDHQQTIKLFQNEAQNGQDAQLKTYANAMLPTLQAHLQEAQALQSNMSGHRTASTGAGGTSATGNTAVGAGNAGTARLNQQELNKIQHR